MFSNRRKRTKAVFPLFSPFNGQILLSEGQSLCCYRSARPDGEKQVHLDGDIPGFRESSTNIHVTLGKHLNIKCRCWLFAMFPNVRVIQVETLCMVTQVKLLYRWLLLALVPEVMAICPFYSFNHKQLWCERICRMFWCPLPHKKSILDSPLLKLENSFFSSESSLNNRLCICPLRLKPASPLEVSKWLEKKPLWDAAMCNKRLRSTPVCCIRILL